MKQRSNSTLIIILLISSLVIGGCRLKSGLAGGQDAQLQEQIGQLLMVGFRGKSIADNSLLQQQLANGRIGGVILFDYDVVRKVADRNIESPEQVEALIQQLQRYAAVPLFVAVDQEGGRVMRLKARYGFPALPSAHYLGELNQLDSTAYYARLNAENLARLGFNVNFAPDVDLNLNPDNPVIGGYERSYGADPEVVIQQAATVIRQQRAAGILSVLKHFPGHGSSTADSHLGITDVSDSWQRQELLPYRRLIEQGLAEAVMSAHVFNRQLDERYPATLSATTIGLLRDSMQFDGLIFSDDMQMKAIADEYGLEQAIVLALQAGIDIIVFGNNLSYDERLPEQFADIVSRAIERGELSREQIQRAYRRIMRFKQPLR